MNFLEKKFLNKLYQVKNAVKFVLKKIAKTNSTIQ